MESKIQYFIERTDDRLRHMELKIDRILQFQSKVLGIVIAVSTIGTIAINLVFVLLTK